MVAPLDAVTVMHNAFRRDLTEIDEAVYKVARHGGDLSPLIDRLHLFVDDHREMDTMSEGLSQVVGAPNELAAARAAAVLHSHVRIHLAKEDAYVYPILGQRLDLEEQAPIVGLMASKVPPEMMPQMVNWLFTLVNQQDRVTMTTVWKAMMPEEVFAGVSKLIQGAVRTDDWSELAKRIPGLA